MTKCKAVTKDGHPCGMSAGESGYCFNHQPGVEAAARRLKARTAGGKARAARTLEKVDLKLETAEDAVKALRDITEWALTGRIDSRVASAATVAISTALRGMEKANVEARVRELQERLEELTKVRLA